MELQKKVFVIMPFGDPIAHDMYTKIVRPLCDSLTLNVIRADEIFSNNVIYDDIWNGINEADIIIADISGKNPNVMYELGIAHAVKRPNTIMLTREEVTESPFDIKHIRIIGYSNDISGTKKLESDLSNTIAVLLENYKITSRNEFEFCLGLYHSVGWLEVLTSCRSWYSVNLHRMGPPSARTSHVNLPLQLPAWCSASDPSSSTKVQVTFYLSDCVV